MNRSPRGAAPAFSSTGAAALPLGQRWPQPLPADPRAATPATAAEALPPEPRRGFKQWMVYGTWVLLVFAPQWLIGGPARQLLTLITLASWIIIATNPPKRGWYAPLLAFWLFNIVTMPFAVNRLYSILPVKILMVYYTISLITVSYLRTPREAWPVLAMMFLWQWAWWLVWGLVPGQVGWHPDLANHDAYGPVMVIGAGVCVYFAQAVRDRRLRIIGYALALLCVGGVVSAFARGAVLTLALVMVLAWIRSPRKGRMTVALLLMAGVVGIAAELLGSSNRSGDIEAGPSSFWAEMATSFQGTESGTGSDRKELWAMAWKLYKLHPIIGVGGANYGPAAATRLRGVDVGGDYAANQSMLYDRALHNVFFQVLCEHGTIGFVIFLWIFVDFWRRNSAMRKRRLADPWLRWSGGQLDLRMLSLGLESGMVGYLGTAFFYNQLTTPWLYALLTTNVLLHVLATRAAKTLGARPATMPSPTPGAWRPPMPVPASR